LPKIQEKVKIKEDSDDYDKDLMVKVGQLETLRWRAGEKLSDDASFQKIVATLKDHAVPETPLTKIGQNPRARFAPKGDITIFDHLKKKALSPYPPEPEEAMGGEIEIK